jgi:hypothetical protein
MDSSLLNEKLGSNLLSSSVLLGQAKMLDLSSRESPAFNDPRYFPFYYHLGSQVSPKVVCQIGCKLGLIGACFLQSCRSTEEWLAMDAMVDNVKPPASIITSNLSLFGKAKVNFMLLNDSMLKMDGVKGFVFGMGLLTEKYSPEKTQLYLDFLWKYLSSEGLLVVDYIQDDAVKGVFLDFCRVKNREPLLFDTRYGVGIVNR